MTKYFCKVMQGFEKVGGRRGVGGAYECPPITCLLKKHRRGRYKTIYRAQVESNCGRSLFQKSAQAKFVTELQQGSRRKKHQHTFWA